MSAIYWQRIRSSYHQGWASNVDSDISSLPGRRKLPILNSFAIVFGIRAPNFRNTCSNTNRIDTISLVYAMTYGFSVVPVSGSRRAVTHLAGPKVHQ